MTNLNKHQANSNQDGLLLHALIAYNIDPELLASFLEDSIDVARKVHALKDPIFQTYQGHEFVEREIKLTYMEILLTRLQKEIFMNRCQS